jgi:hypothetical protein
VIGTYHVDHISEEVHNYIDGKFKISLDPILYRPSAKIYFPVEFKVISNILPNVEVTNGIRQCEFRHKPSKPWLRASHYEGPLNMQELTMEIYCNRNYFF